MLRQAAAGIPLFTNVFIQIIPFRIALFDQPQLPYSLPRLDLFFTYYRAFGGLVNFIPDKKMNVIFLRKPVCQIVFMLVNALDEVGGNACVQCAVSFTAKNIDVEILHK
jgi:hypothetical protein